MLYRLIAFVGILLLGYQAKGQCRAVLGTLHTQYSQFFDSLVASDSGPFTSLTIPYSACLSFSIDAHGSVMGTELTDFEGYKLPQPMCSKILEMAQRTDGLWTLSGCNKDTIKLVVDFSAYPKQMSMEESAAYHDKRGRDLLANPDELRRCLRVYHADAFGYMVIEGR
jgi:hypothetical protein